MIPVYEIINYSGNRYLLTRAIMKRAREINFVGDEDLENYNGKIASLSLRQILNEEIKYTLMEDEIKLKNI